MMVIEEGTIVRKARPVFEEGIAKDKYLQLPTNERSVSIATPRRMTYHVLQMPQRA